MTVPLIALAFFSVVVAWPLPSGPRPEHGHGGYHWNLVNAEESSLEHWLHHAQPQSVLADFGMVLGHDSSDVPFRETERALAHENHDFARLLALGMVILGLTFAVVLYSKWRVLDPADAKEQFPGVYTFLTNKWYFDELYSALLVRPALAVAGWLRGFDLKGIDGVVHAAAGIGVWLSWVHGLSDRYIVDGLVNLTARVLYGVGNWLRTVQTGYLRSYVLFLVLAAVGIWIVLTMLLGSPAAGGGPFP